MDRLKPLAVAKLIKKADLSSNPMMDSVAIALNCEPTYNEIQRAKMYMGAIVHLGYTIVKEGS